MVISLDSSQLVSQIWWEPLLSAEQADFQSDDK